MNRSTVQPTLIATAIGVAILVGFAGCGGGPAPPGAANTTSTSALASDRFDGADLKALDYADTAMQDSVEHFQASLHICVTSAINGGTAAAVACFQRKYAPYAASLKGLQFQFQESVDKATGRCGINLAEAQTALVASEAASEALRQAFVRRDFGAISTGAFEGKFSAYRDTMDQALAECADSVPGFTSVRNTPTQ